MGVNILAPTRQIQNFQDDVLTLEELSLGGSVRHVNRALLCSRKLSRRRGMGYAVSQHMHEKQVT